VAEAAGTMDDSGHRGRLDLEVSDRVPRPRTGRSARHTGHTDLHYRAQCPDCGVHTDLHYECGDCGTVCETVGEAAASSSARAASGR